MGAVNDNIPHPQYFDMMTEFGDQAIMRISARRVDRKFASNLFWFMRFEKEMLEWEVNNNRANLQVVE